MQRYRLKTKEHLLSGVPLPRHNCAKSSKKKLYPWTSYHNLKQFQTPVGAFKAGKSPAEVPGSFLLPLLLFYSVCQAILYRNFLIFNGPDGAFRAVSLRENGTALLTPSKPSPSENAVSAAREGLRCRMAEERRAARSRDCSPGHRWRHPTQRAVRGGSAPGPGRCCCRRQV